MTVITVIVGLLPIMWGSGTGSEVMRRIAAPMVGGMVTATVLTLVIIPSLYLIVNGWRLPQGVESRHERHRHEPDGLLPRATRRRRRSRRPATAAMRSDGAAHRAGPCGSA